MNIVAWDFHQSQTEQITYKTYMKCMKKVNSEHLPFCLAEHHGNIKILIQVGNINWRRQVGSLWIRMVNCGKGGIQVWKGEWQVPDGGWRMSIRLVDAKNQKGCIDGLKGSFFYLINKGRVLLASGCFQDGIHQLLGIWIRY